MPLVPLSVVLSSAASMLVLSRANPSLAIPHAPTYRVHKANIAKGMRWLMDNTDHGSKLGKGHRCTVCKQVGHNRRTCTAGQGGTPAAL